MQIQFKTKFIVDELYRKPEFASKTIPIPGPSITVNNTKSNGNINLDQGIDLKQGEDHNVKATQPITQKIVQNSINHIESPTTSFLKTGRLINNDSNSEEVAKKSSLTPNRQANITNTNVSEGLI